MKEKVINWGGKGPLIHLAHANSYHPGTYKELIDLLTPHFEVQSVLTRPFLPKYKVEDMNTWNQFRDDFLEVAEKQNWKDIIGLGHSLGSTITMMAAIERPELFKKLIIIEPPCIDQVIFTLLSVLPFSAKKNLVPPSKIALKRRHKWNSREEAFEWFRGKSIYDRVSDETLKAFVTSGLKEDDFGALRLSHSKFWESKIYCTIKNPYKLFPQLMIPSLCIRGDESDVILERNWNKWQKLQENAQFVNIPASGHLVPLEQSHLLARHIIDFISEN